MDRESFRKRTKEIVGVFIGARSESGARRLWNFLPAVYRQYDVYYKDFWTPYQKVLPNQRHKAVSKASGKINHVKRFNNTIRPRISRLVRETFLSLKN